MVVWNPFGEDSQITTISFEGKQPASGDSGSGLVIYSETGSYTLIGIHSYVHFVSRFFPAEFTRVSYYMDWITHKTSLNFT